MENSEEVANVPPENGKKPPKASTSNDEKAPDSSDNTTQQKPKVAKAKKRKKPKDSTAPRHPLTGYVRYLNDRRETVRSANPTLSFAEITKMLANEWTNLPADKKQQYLDAAEQDRERYTREYNAYKQTEAYKLFTQQQNEKKMKESKEESKSSVQPVINKEIPDMDFGNFDIPIFTEEFLDHNKMRDSELRQLRKSNTDYEQQNAILQKHIENMKDAIAKLESEISQQEKNNASLQKHLDHLRGTLTNGFSGVKLPGVKEVATQQNIDSYMTNLHSILLENSSHDANLLHTVRNIVGRLEFNG
ncbi:high mobility group protein 20A [Tribolium castaneum]|uniref:High mobility group protein 20A-like Protein n=1 Tax=Tribolium castaneum TaxID=7070 RepID=D6WST5_TRICA|nr:PREDICTED: high mobility group protein 20A [Tribolium castaneum]EFA06355.1 High mobility group protein 20A-like Protein [Tribolium castaneum]|eukprot:XP_008195357.1 PREDICTED: high mobility group protein 20A [Tribolium castaneum]